MATSQFPIQIDSLKRVQDFPASQATNVARYNTLKEKSNLTTAEQNELNGLKVTLSPYIYEAEDVNLQSDAIENVQKFVKNNIDGYMIGKQNETYQFVELKKDEFQATLNKFDHKNLYSNVVSYQKWNTVTYDGETFLSRHDNNLGNTPIGDIGDAHWAKIASRGKQGVPGIGLVFTGEYNNAMTYQPQSAVRYEGSIYYCIAPSVGNLPTDTNYWVLYMDAKSVVISNVAPENPNANPVWIDTSV